MVATLEQAPEDAPESRGIAPTSVEVRIQALSDRLGRGADWLDAAAAWLDGHPELRGMATYQERQEQYNAQQARWVDLSAELEQLRRQALAARIEKGWEWLGAEEDWYAEQERAGRAGWASVEERRARYWQVFAGWEALLKELTERCGGTYTVLADEPAAAEAGAA